MNYNFKPSKYIGGKNKKKYWFIVEKIKSLSKLAFNSIEVDLANRLTAGQVLVNNQFMYLNRDKYRGRGRPRKSDYKKSPTLYINK